VVEVCPERTEEDTWTSDCPPVVAAVVVVVVAAAAAVVVVASLAYLKISYH